MIQFDDCAKNKSDSAWEKNHQLVLWLPLWGGDLIVIHENLPTHNFFSGSFLYLEPTMSSSCHPGICFQAQET